MTPRPIIPTVTAAPACPFGAPWDELRLHHVRAFFRRSATERSTWEAKQNTTKGELAGFIRKESCGFANRRGGYLVLGAEEHGAAWNLSGIEVPNVSEVHDWVASLLRQLEPQPLFDVYEWGLSNSRKVVIVQIEEAPIPPVTYKGVVYIRHGTQTLKADGPAVGRLADAGRRARSRVEDAARKQAKQTLEQIWVPFALVLARHGERRFRLDDPRPEEILEDQMVQTLRCRWHQREYRPLMWASDEMSNLKAVGFEAQKKQPPPFKGWRVGWQASLKAPPIKQRKRFRYTPYTYDPMRIDRSRGDDQLWVGSLTPDNISWVFQWPHPAGRTTPYWHYGMRAISNAALLLRALIRTEIILGADQSEQAFVCLALKQRADEVPVIFERWEHLAVQTPRWQHAMEVDAGRRMHLG